MKRTERFLHRWTTCGENQVRAFLVLGSAFVLGALLGLLAASMIGQESCDNLEQFFRSYTELTPGRTYTWSGFLQTLWYFIRFPLLLLLAGFSALGVFIIPVALSLKGFSFSFAVSALVLLYGLPGLIAAGGVFWAGGSCIDPHSLFDRGVELGPVLPYRLWTCDQQRAPKPQVRISVAQRCDCCACGNHFFLIPSFGAVGAAICIFVLSCFERRGYC